MDYENNIEPDRPPLTLDEEFELPVQEGRASWYDIARKENPARMMQEPAGCVELSRALLVEGPQLVRNPAVTPEYAPSYPGGPRSIGRPRADTRRRFNGARVHLVAGNFTQIYNGESRSLYADTSVPWVHVGRISVGRGVWGTAALVGQSTILTAAHVVKDNWTPGGPVTGSPIFVPAMFNGSSLLGSAWQANVIGIAAWERDVGVDGYDMAICQLDQPFGAWLGSFGTRRYDDDWEDRGVWSHAGYPWDMSMSGVSPSFELGISVNDDDSDSYDTLEVETKADIASGQSGGPLWGRWPDGRYIIGTLSGREDNFAEPKNSLFSGGNGLNRLVRWGRDHWG